MKLSKTKKIFLLGTTLAILTTSIAVPIVLLNKHKNSKENDVEKLFKILKNKTTKAKIIELVNNASGKIIADNQAKIIEKIKTLIGKANLKEVKIEVLMQDDSNISTTPQKIIIKLTKNEFSKEIEDFSVKKQSIIDVNKDIAAIKNILDAKMGEDLIIILPSSSRGNIIENNANKNEIEKKLRILIDPLNRSGEANHASLRGTSIEISMNADAPISTTPQNIILSISKTSGTSLSTTKTFQVKRDFTIDEDIQAIKNILESKTGEDLIITLPNSSTGNIIENATNKNAIIKKLRILVDPSNTSGKANHESLRGTSIEVSMNADAPISTTLKNIIVSISKNDGTTLSTTKTFQVKRDFTADEDIAAIKEILEAKTGQELIIILSSDSTGTIINNKNAIIKKLRILIDPSNIRGEANHESLRGTNFNIIGSGLISTTPKYIYVLIFKPPAASVEIEMTFQVKKLK